MCLEGLITVFRRRLYAAAVAAGPQPCSLRPLCSGASLLAVVVRRQGGTSESFALCCFDFALWRSSCVVLACSRGRCVLWFRRRVLLSPGRDATRLSLALSVGGSPGRAAPLTRKRNGEYAGAFQMEPVSLARRVLPPSGGTPVSKSEYAWVLPPGWVPAERLPAQQGVGLAFGECRVHFRPVGKADVV